MSESGGITEFIENYITEISKHYYAKNFVLPQDNTLSFGYTMHCHIEDFMDCYNKIPEIRMNLETSKSFSFSVLSLTGTMEQAWRINDESDRAFESYEGCKIIIDNDLCNYEVELR